MDGLSRRIVDLDGLKIRGFTGRQIDILTYLQQGHTLETIAGAMGCKRETVKTRLKRLTKRLDADGWRELVGTAVSLCVAMNGQTESKTEPPAARKTATAYPDLSVLCSAGYSQLDVKILDLLQRDHLDKEIAQKLGMSFSAVRKHLHKIGRRLGARGRVNIIAKAYIRCRELEEAGE